MSRVIIQTALAATLALSAALLAGPKFVSTWKAPEAAGTSFAGKKVAALLISDDQDLRVSGEEALVRELAGSASRRGSPATASCPVKSCATPTRREMVQRGRRRGRRRDAARQGGQAHDVVAVDVERTILQHALGLLRLRLGSCLQSGVTRTDTVAVVETLIFSVPQNKLLWAGVTESTNPKDAARIIKDIVERRR